ncbi:MAG: hypothetical protein RIE56_06535 [Amphiplicatus sp.]
MILRRVIAHFRKQEWTAIALDFLIVVVGVFVGLQVSNWNETRSTARAREQIIQALVTDLRDAQEAQRGFDNAISTGLADWQASFEAGNLPSPFYMRIEGSDTAPKTWETLRPMPLSEMFDPVTLFDLGFYYSEMDGVGVKYIRYVSFVESDILPNLKRDASVFYNEDRSALHPEYEASMDRLRDYASESRRLGLWANCLIYRLEATRKFSKSCRRADFMLEGMAPDRDAGQ